MRITLHGTPKVITEGSLYLIEDGNTDWLIVSDWCVSGEGRWDVEISSVTVSSRGTASIHCKLLDCNEKPQEAQEEPFRSEMDTCFPF